MLIAGALSEKYLVDYKGILSPAKKCDQIYFSFESGLLLLILSMQLSVDVVVLLLKKSEYFSVFYFFVAQKYNIESTPSKNNNHILKAANNKGSNPVTSL